MIRVTMDWVWWCSLLVISEAEPEASELVWLLQRSVEVWKSTTCHCIPWDSSTQCFCPEAGSKMNPSSTVILWIFLLSLEGPSLKVVQWTPLLSLEARNRVIQDGTGSALHLQGRVPYSVSLVVPFFNPVRVIGPFSSSLLLFHNKFQSEFVNSNSLIE